MYCLKKVLKIVNDMMQQNGMSFFLKQLSSDLWCILLPRNEKNSVQLDTR